MKLLIAEKPSVGTSIAAVLGAKKRHEGYTEGNGFLVSWCIGNLCDFVNADAYDEKYGKSNISNCVAKVIVAIIRGTSMSIR